MTRDEYERSKARLEEQRRSGAELVERAYQAQVRALELVWTLQGEGDGAGTAPPSPALATAAPGPAKEQAPPQRLRRSPLQVEADVRAALPRLPESFTRREVVEILGYEPDRGTLYRCLRKLVADGRTRVESAGDGQRATVYRKTGGENSPAHS